MNKDQKAKQKKPIVLKENGFLWRLAESSIFNSSSWAAMFLPIFIIVFVITVNFIHNFIALSIISIIATIIIQAIFKQILIKLVEKSKYVNKTPATPNMATAPPVKPLATATPPPVKPLANTPSFEEALNSYQFYFSLLPAIWDAPERRKMMITLFDTKGGKDCMGLILNALNATFFPDQQNNPLMKVIGLKLIGDFNDENYSKMFVINRVSLKPGYHILEVDFLMYENQKIMAKVEKVYLVCTLDYLQGKVITLESSSTSEHRFLCATSPDGKRVNYGAIENNDVNTRLIEII